MCFYTGSFTSCGFLQQNNINFNQILTPSCMQMFLQANNACTRIPILNAEQVKARSESSFGINLISCLCDLQSGNRCPKDVRPPLTATSCSSPPSLTSWSPDRSSDGSTDYCTCRVHTCNSSQLHIWSFQGHRNSARAQIISFKRFIFRVLQRVEAHNNFQASFIIC